MAGAARRCGARASLLPSWARGDGVNAGAGAHLFYLPGGYEVDWQRRVVALQMKTTLELPRGGGALRRRHGGLFGEDWKSFRLDSYRLVSLQAR